MKYDFSGYVTKNDLMCSDGRTIRRNAFKENDGSVVPLVWNHRHDDPTNILGHALLENREDGVYGYCSLNDTEQGQHAKELVKHGDICAMSIFANRLQQKGGDVFHGVIREVSLVLAGANPGAYIEDKSFMHSDGSVEYLEEDEAIIHSDSPLNTVEHADKEENMNTENETESNDETIEDVFNTLNEKQKQVVYYLIGQTAEGEDVDVEEEEIEETVSHADGDSSDDETIEDVFNTLNEKQKQVVYYLIGQAAKGEDVDVEEVDEEEEVTMKHNIFDEETTEDTLSHSELNAIVAESLSGSKMSDAFIQHGIEDIDYLFPDARTLTSTPDMITRPMGWVPEVWNATKKNPFSRIKSVAANLTEDEARAKGYIKGKKKLEEQFGLLKRTTTPQTVYKKQALDRDDIIDITDFDVVVWLKAEMRTMLDEELARAILVGDGRSAVAEDKIKEDNIRPIYQDADLYTIHYAVNIPANATNDQKSEILVDSAVRSRKEYRGSGNPVLYASTDVINDMLLARDDNRRRMYNNEQDLAAALRVSKIVEVPVLEGVKRTDAETNKTYELLGLIVNLSDYTVGADKGGEVNFFDDFDIDFNKEKYLIETRLSGALTHPYSAIALEKEVTTGSTSTPSTPSTPEALG